jgi:hypothetical protein
MTRYSLARTCSRRRLAALIFLTARVVFHRAEYRFAEEIKVTGR